MSSLATFRSSDEEEAAARSTQHLLGTQFLKLLCTAPSGDAVAYALVNGPCAAYQAPACAIYLVSPDRTHLDLVGEHGFGPQPLERYQRIPLRAGIPGAVAFRTGEPILVRGDEAEAQFPLLSAFFTSEPMGRHCDWICLPLSHLGVGLGTIVIACPTGLNWGWAEHGHFTGFSAAVSLWARIELNKPQLPPGGQRRSGTGTVGLTERQMQVLVAISQGRPNKTIARELGYSISTIKAEVQEILACLGAANRREATALAERAGILTPDPNR